MLHDQIDAQEELRELVAARVDAIREDVKAIASDLESIDQIFEAIGIRLGNELAEETTKAVRQGYEFAQRRLNHG